MSQWKLPKGFTAGPLRWPVPVAFVQPGDIAGYGYEHTVLLTARVTAPKDLPAGRVKIAAEASWLLDAADASRQRGHSHARGQDPGEVQGVGGRDSDLDVLFFTAPFVAQLGNRPWQRGKNSADSQC